MSALDHIDISFKNFKKDKITIFVVTEGPNGEIQYLPGKEIHPEDGYKYSFML